MITGAGVVLAATFPDLAVLPLLSPVGVLVGLGVLLDTLVVRSVLVPAPALDVGRAIWWPDRLAAGNPFGLRCRTPNGRWWTRGRAERRRGATTAPPQGDHQGCGAGVLLPAPHPVPPPPHTGPGAHRTLANRSGRYGASSSDVPESSTSPATSMDRYGASVMPLCVAAT